MKPIRKRRLALIAGVIVVSMIAVETLVESFSVTETVRIIERRLSDASGMSVHLGRDFHLEILPVLRFETHDVLVADPQRPSPPMLQIGTLRFELDPWRLVFGAIEIDALDISGAELFIESGVAARGATAVDPAGATAPSGDGIAFQTRRIDIEDLGITYRGESNEPVRRIEFEEVSLEAEEFDAPVAVALNGTFEGDEFDAEGQIGPIADLIDPPSPYPVSLRAEMHEMVVELQGSVAEPTAFAGVDLLVNLAARDLGFIDTVVEWPLPAIDSVQLEARLSDADGSLGIDGKIHIAARNGEISGDINGKLGDLSKSDDIELQISLAARNLAEIGASWQPELTLPEVGPVAARVALRGSRSALSADDFRLAVGSREAVWLEAGGSVADLANFTGVQLAGEFAGADLRYANPYLDRQLPDLGPVGGSARLSDRDGSLGIEELRITGGLEGSLTFDFSGSVDRMHDRDEIEVRANLEAKNLGLVGDLFGIDLPAVGPVTFSGTMKGSDERIESSGSTKIGRSILTGDLSGSFAGRSRKSIRARLRSQNLRLDDLGIAPDTDQGDAEVGSANSTGWWSSHDPLPFEWLDVIDADLVLAAERVSGTAGFELDGVHISVQLEDGRLEIPEFSVGYEAGMIRTQAHVDVSGFLPELALKIDVNDVHLTPLLAQVRQTVAEAGLLDASIDVRSDGNSAVQLRSNLTGTVLLIGRDGTLAGSYSSEFAKNFAVLAVPSILTGRTPRFGCIVADFAIENGVASARELLVESEKISVVGSGTVDIGRDAFDIMLIPKVHEPGLVSLAAAVKVSGPLSDPVFSPQYTSMPMQAVRGFMSNLLAPGSALIKPFRRSKDAGRCDKLRPLEPAGP